MYTLGINAVFHDSSALLKKVTEAGEVKRGLVGAQMRTAFHSILKESVSRPAIQAMFYRPTLYPTLVRRKVNSASNTVM